MLAEHIISHNSWFCILVLLYLIALSILKKRKTSIVCVRMFIYKKRGKRGVF